MGKVKSTLVDNDFDSFSVDANGNLMIDIHPTIEEIFHEMLVRLDLAEELYEPWSMLPIRVNP